ncbi:hypothetical protein J2X72_004899 [Phyllobacterium sp. 1468]|uniref:hypothetical protein n=1 Tax=Phyllobacterium sp. 1468 TaxID=2817759 RepID=UPI00285BF9B1|nr:hypothetical protein [Phyllobacterium sp. 1468]MDR6636085.1 hypothetical protein [Phyllobacterium sp. 1468]
MIDQRTDGAVFASINLHLNGLWLRFPFQNVFVGKDFAIGAVAVSAPEFEASDFATVAEHVGKTASGEARGLSAFPAAGSHQHPMPRGLP